MNSAGETAYEIGTTLSTAVLGGVLVAWYTRVVFAEIEVLDLPAPLAERASTTLAEALLVAGEVEGGTGASILQIAEAAFTAITVTGVAGAGIMVVAAISPASHFVVQPRTKTSHQSTSIDASAGLHRIA